MLQVTTTMQFASRNTDCGSGLVDLQRNKLQEPYPGTYTDFLQGRGVGGSYLVRNQSLTTVQSHKHSNQMCISRLGSKNFLTKVSTM